MTLKGINVGNNLNSSDGENTLPIHHNDIYESRKRISSTPFKRENTMLNIVRSFGGDNLDKKIN